MKPGTAVKLRHDDGDDEYGVVVASWLNDGETDCYVAFFKPPPNASAAPEMASDN